MGSIVSVNKKGSLHDLEVYPSQAVALQAKLRQAALSMHPHLVRRLPHSDAYGAGHGGPDWYPAGISPWYLDKDGDIVGRDATAEHSHEWMDHLSLTKRDLHKSAIFIQKLVRGRQVRRELHTQQQSARKIQRVFRRWRSGIVLLASSLPALPTSSVAPSSGRVYSADTCTCNRSVPQRILFTDGGHERSILIDGGNERSTRIDGGHERSTRIGGGNERSTWRDGGHERSTRIGEEIMIEREESTWNQQNSYHFPTETIMRENKSLANKPISSDNQTELNQLNGSHNNVQHHMNGLNLDNVMQFPQSLTTPAVGTVHSRSPPRPTPVFRGMHMKSTGQGNPHHLSDMRNTGRQDHALAPASMLKHRHRWGANNNDMLCNTGTSMKLQDANKRWVKPSHKERRQPHVSWKMSGEMTRPPTVLVETPHIEDTRPPTVLVETPHTEDTRPPTVLVETSHTRPPTVLVETPHIEDTRPPTVLVETPHIEDTRPPTVLVETSHTEDTRPPTVLVETPHTEDTRPPTVLVETPHTEDTGPPTVETSHTEDTRPPTVLVETPHTEDTRPPTVETSHTEDTILHFITEESQVSSNVCPVQSVDYMLELLSEGMNKPLDQIPAQQDDGVTLRVTRELVHTVHSVIKRQLTANHIRGRGGARGLPGESTLFQTSDVESLLRAAKFRDDVLHKLKQLKHLTASIRLDYYQMMDDIDRVQFFAAQQVEAGLRNYQPQKVVLISSTIPKAQTLTKAVRDDVLATVYDFSSGLAQVLEVVRGLLEGVRAGAKAQHIAIVTKGGPGYIYLVKNNPVTPAKLRKNQAMLAFWRGLGELMSKLVPGQSTIHFMESNMRGNKQGEKLLKDLESVLFAHQVQVSCPLEIAPKGRDMINLYFDPVKHKLWKSTRYTKLRLY